MRGATNPWRVVRMSEMSSSSVAPESGRKSALIVEGGAMRGAWAAGVLAFLYERGMNRYDMVYAASSGACSAAFFVAGMVEPGLAIWREHAWKLFAKQISFAGNRLLILPTWWITCSASESISQWKPFKMHPPVFALC